MRPRQRSVVVVSIALILGLFASALYLGVGTADARPARKALGEQVSSESQQQVLQDIREIPQIKQLTEIVIADPLVVSTPNSQPGLDVLVTVVSDYVDCPLSFEDAQAVSGNPDVSGTFDTIEAEVGATVTYCINAENTGGTAYDVSVETSVGEMLIGSCGFAGCDPGLWHGLNDYLNWFEVVVTDEVPQVVTISGSDANGNQANGSGTTDSAGVQLVTALAPELDVLLTVAPNAAACPQTFADAEAVDYNPGVDDSDPATGPDFDTMAAEWFQEVTFCVNLINRGGTAYGVEVFTLWGGGAQPVVTCGVVGCEDWWAPGSQHSYSYQHQVVDAVGQPGEDPHAVVIVGYSDAAKTEQADGSGKIDQAGVVVNDSDPALPDLEVLLTAAPDASSCPATFAEALDVVNNPDSNGTFDVMPTQLGLVTRFCVNAIKRVATAYDVRIERNAGEWDFRPGVPTQDGTEWTDGNEYADNYFYTSTPENLGESPHVVTIFGYDAQGAPLEGSGSSDSSGIIFDPATHTEIDVLLTAVLEDALCPATFDAAEAVVNNPDVGGDNGSLPSAFDTVSVADGDTVKFCVNAINRGPSRATNVQIQVIRDQTQSGYHYPVTCGATGCEEWWAAGSEYTYSYEQPVSLGEFAHWARIVGADEVNNLAFGSNTFDHAGVDVS